MREFLERQEKAINFFHKQQEKGMISHAYLLVGNDALMMANYIAMSIYCPEQKVGACLTCNTCQRVSSNSYADYKIFSKEESIKKEDIHDIKKYFSTTTLEKNNHSVYTLDKIESASVSAMNSLLKFLEEPETNITAILTTNNLKDILETIQSRCLIIQLEDQNMNQIVRQFTESGFEYDYVASLLSCFIDEKQFMSLLENEKYKFLYDSILKFNDLYVKNRALAATFLQTDLINKQKVNAEEYRIFLEMFVSLTQDLELKEILLTNYDRIDVGMIVNLLIDYLTVDLIKGVS